MPVLSSKEIVKVQFKPHATLRIDPETMIWEEIGNTDPRAKLLAKVEIGGAKHWLEARQVHAVMTNRGERFQSVEDHADMIKLEIIANGGNSAFSEFVTIEGRQYFLFMMPASAY